MTTACSRKVQFANNPQSSKVSVFFDPEPRCFGRLEVFAKGWQQGWLAVEAVCACSKQGQAGGRLREASPVLPVLGWPPLMEEGTAGWLEADSPEADSFPDKSGDSRYLPSCRSTIQSCFVSHPPIS